MYRATSLEINILNSPLIPRTRETCRINNPRIICADNGTPCLENFELESIRESYSNCHLIVSFFLRGIFLEKICFLRINSKAVNFFFFLKKKGQSFESKRDDDRISDQDNFNSNNFEVEGYNKRFLLSKFSKQT